MREEDKEEAQEEEVEAMVVKIIGKIIINNHELVFLPDPCKVK